MPRKRRHYRSGSVTLIRGALADSWEGYIRINGATHRTRHKSEAQAMAWIDMMEASRETPEAPLTAADLLDASRARSALDPAVSLQEAVNFYNRHNTRAIDISLSEASERFLSAKSETGKAVDTLRGYRKHMRHLLKIGGDRLVHDLQPEDLERCFEADHGAKTRNNMIATWSVFFEFAIKRGWAASNPARRIERHTMPENLPDIFTLSETAAFLYVLASLFPELLGEYALGFFAGIRPTELKRLKWGAVTDDHTLIDATIAKGRRRRFIAATPNLGEWLAMVPDRSPDRRVCYGGKKWRQETKNIAMQIAGIEKWPSDVVRHTYASNHLAWKKNAPETQLEMGHRDSGVLFQHYRNLVKQDDSEAYFGLNPANCYNHICENRRREILNRVISELCKIRNRDS